MAFDPQEYDVCDECQTPFADEEDYHLAHFADGPGLVHARCCKRLSCVVARNRAERTAVLRVPLDSGGRSFNVQDAPDPYALGAALALVPKHSQIAPLLAEIVALGNGDTKT